MGRASIGGIGAAIIAMSGCAPSPSQLTPDKQILRRVLQGLSAGAYPICVNNQANGDSLRLWRDSIVIARASGHSLGWQDPEALRPPADMPAPVSGGKTQPTAIAPLIRRANLPHQEIVTLDAAVNRLSVQQDAAPAVVLQSGWMPPGVTTRWWPLNRIAGCEPYRLSAPYRFGNLAFVQVQSNHWGTVYALRRMGDQWRIIAQAAPWLY